MRVQDLRDSKYEYAAYHFHKRGWAERFRWEACVAKKPKELRLKVKLGGEDPGQVQLTLGFLWFSIYLTIHGVLPKRWEVGWFERDGVRNPKWHDDSHGREFGFYYFERALVLLWNSSVISGGSDRKRYGYSKHFYMPWDWGSCVAHEVQNEQFQFVPAGPEYSAPYSDGRKIHTAPYRYTRKSGEVQEVTATFYVERREWRWNLFRKLGLRMGPKRVSTTISVSFSGELGEGTGSWKGGTVGCSYEMYPEETPLMTLRRMERERKFSR